MGIIISFTACLMNALSTFKILLLYIYTTFPKGIFAKWIILAINPLHLSLGKIVEPTIIKIHNLHNNNILWCYELTVLNIPTLETIGN